MSKQFVLCPRLVLSGVMLAALTACGGGSDGGTPLSALAPQPSPLPPQPSPLPPQNEPPSNNQTGTNTPVIPTPLPITCYDGKQANPVGAEDPFYVNAWHLKNTGPEQQVSAATNKGVADIDANVENVHKNGLGCTGKGVTIAIVDSGMEVGHEDLKPNVLTGKSFNFATESDDPSPAPAMQENDHGTGVAGVAAARGWNGLGARGTAPLASLVAYPTIGVTPKSSTEDNMNYLAFGARALADPDANATKLFGDRADGTSIFNHSAGADYAAPMASLAQDDASELALKWGTSNLRGGLGAIYFQAAGNEYQDMTGLLPDGERIPVNCSAHLTEDAELLGGQLTNLAGMSCGNSNQEPFGKPYFYQVAAIHNTGKASSYSSAGAANWVTGFGGENGKDEAAIISTDNSSCSSGDNNLANKGDWLAQFGNILSKLVANLFGESPKDPQCNYTGTTNGTSAATPSVAGVAALMLETNPKLTWQDVGYILARTARKVDDTIASGERAVRFNPLGEAAPWSLEEPWITNAAGFNFQNRYGFGLVDADAAVKLAANYSTPAGRRSVPLVVEGRAASFYAMNGVGTQGTYVTFSNTDAKTGTIRVDLTLENTTGKDINPGALQFQLLNLYTGTKSILMPAFTSWYVGGKQFPIKDKATQSFRFHTNAFYGESLGGLFSVRVVDFSGASVSEEKMLKFTPTLTSFSM